MAGCITLVVVGLLVSVIIHKSIRKPLMATVISALAGVTLYNLLVSVFTFALAPLTPWSLIGSGIVLALISWIVGRVIQVSRPVM